MTAEGRVNTIVTPFRMIHFKVFKICEQFVTDWRYDDGSLNLIAPFATRFVRLPPDYIRHIGFRAVEKGTVAMEVQIFVLAFLDALRMVVKSIASVAYMDGAVVLAFVSSSKTTM